jgi:hypothetical protein
LTLRYIRANHSKKYQIVLKICGLLPIWKKAGAHTHEKARIALHWQVSRSGSFGVACLYSAHISSAHPSTNFGSLTNLAVGNGNTALMQFNATGRSSTTGPQGLSFVFVGTWAIGTNYGFGQTVFFQGASYISQVNGNTGHQPETDGGVHWALIAQQGAAGAAGTAGATGAQGPIGLTGATEAIGTP